jgi:hypothetical protein
MLMGGACAKAYGWSAQEKAPSGCMMQVESPLSQAGAAAYVIGPQW